jgi:DNA-binding Lrp family transcriptional regulator
MTHAVVLVEAERDALSTLGGMLADLDGVGEAYSVTGEWDFVAIIRVPRHEQLAEVITGELVKLEELWYFKGTQRGQWERVPFDELPNAKIMVALDPYHLTIDGVSQRNEYAIPEAVYIAL